MLVDDHSIMRDLLRDALEDTGEFEVVAQAADGEEALRMAEEATPDVVVMDIIMPVMDGIEACRKITDRLPDTKVLMLTASNEKDAIVQSVGAGATGYLQKYSSKEQFLATLREVAEGEFRIPGDAARQISQAVRSSSAGSESEQLDSLTDREKEILKPTFPILGVFRLKGQPKRDSGSIVRSCKASQSPVYPIRDAFAVVEHPSCPSSSSSCPLPVG